MRFGTRLSRVGVPASFHGLASAILRLLSRSLRQIELRALAHNSVAGADSDPRAIPRLLATGMRALSMAPALVGGAKLAIAAVDLRAISESEPWPS